MEETNWESGDCVCAPDRSDGYLAPDEVLRRIAVGFRCICIDWPQGDCWVEARIAKATEIGFRGALLETEHALRGKVARVSVTDAPDVSWVRFYLTPDTGALELHYSSATAQEPCRALASKLARLLGYEFLCRGADAQALNCDQPPDPTSN